MTAATRGVRAETAALAFAPTVRPRTLFLLAAIPVLILYGSTRARTVTGEDSGELVTAAYQLGVAHPPGYPLWVLLTKAFQTVFAGLNPADAAALGSSITTAAAVGLLALIAFRLTRSAAASLVGAWSVGVGHEIWNHATIAEIYPLSLFLLAASLLLLLRWRDDPTHRRFFTLTLVYGCGLVNHPTFHLFLPLFGIAVVVTRPRILRDWRAVGLGLLGLLLPHIAYLQTFFAAAGRPFLSWGVEPTFRSVLGHYLREIYTIGPAKTPASVAKVLGQLETQGAFIVANLSLAGLIVGALGLVHLVRRDRVFGGLLLALALLGTVGLLPFVPFDVEREDLFASRVFLMPAYLIFGVGIAVAASRLSAVLPEPGRRPFLRLAVIVPMLVMVFQYQAHDRTRYFWSEDYGRAILSELPKNAVLLPGGDTSTFPLLYLQGCERLRPDVLILDRSGTIEHAEALSLLPERSRAELRGAPRETLMNAIMTLSGRPVITLKPEHVPPVLEIVYEPFQMGFMVIPSHDKAAKEKLATVRQAFFGKLHLRNEALLTVEDYTADVIRTHLAQARALHFFRSGNPPAALDQVERAARYSAGIKETFNNLGSLVAENGLPDRSEMYFREALAIRADYQLARQNLVVVLRNQEKLDLAFAEAELGTRIQPASDFFFQEATDLAVARGDGDDLARLCHARIAALPADSAPHRILGEWALNHEHSEVVAKAHFEAALAVDPKDEKSRRKLKEVSGKTPATGDLARGDDQKDPVAEFAALLPQSDFGLRRDFAAPGRARRLLREELADPISGAAALRSILEQMRTQSAMNPLGDLGLPEERRATIQKQPDPVEDIGKSRGDER